MLSKGFIGNFIIPWHYMCNGLIHLCLLKKNLCKSSLYICYNLTTYWWNRQWISLQTWDLKSHDLCDNYPTNSSFVTIISEQSICMTGIKKSSLHVWGRRGRSTCTALTILDTVTKILWEHKKYLFPTVS